MRLKFGTKITPQVLVFWTMTIYNLKISVMRVGSDTFGNPIFQKGLQN